MSGCGEGLVYSRLGLDGGMPKGASACVCVCVCVCVKERLGPELLGHPTSKSYVGII